MVVSYVIAKVIFITASLEPIFDIKGVIASRHNQIQSDCIESTPRGNALRMESELQDGESLR